MSNCYERAFNHVVFNSPESTRLAHGAPRLQVESDNNPAGTKYGHAWVEYLDLDWMCYDPMADIHLPLSLYYELGQINPREVRRYNAKQAAAKAVELRHYGPWHEIPNTSYLQGEPNE